MVDWDDVKEWIQPVEEDGIKGLQVPQSCTKKVYLKKYDQMTPASNAAQISHDNTAHVFVSKEAVSHLRDMV